MDLLKLILEFSKSQVVFVSKVLGKHFHKCIEQGVFHEETKKVKVITVFMKEGNVSNSCSFYVSLCL